MMARTDIHLDAMLRHLGAAYYDSRHGRATRSDVNRALDTVEEHLHEQHPYERTPHPAPTSPPPAHHSAGTRHRRWARRVTDVMTTSVMTVDRITPFQEIDRVLISGPRHRPVTCEVSEPPECHLGATGVVDAEEQDAGNPRCRMVISVDERSKALVGEPLGADDEPSVHRRSHREFNVAIEYEIPDGLKTEGATEPLLEINGHTSEAVPRRLRYRVNVCHRSPSVSLARA